MITKEQIKQKLEVLHERLLDKLLIRVQSEDCSAQELKLAWDILQDNNVITADLKAARAAAGGTPVEQEEPLVDSLPFPGKTSVA